jgi:hypothetical protein
VTDSAPVAPEGFEAAARAALAEVTAPGGVGELILAEQPAEDVTDLEFASTLPGYVGWRWTVSMARLPGEPPSVLEVELLPREGALLAPAWVPWAERLAEYRRTHPDEADVVVVDELDELDEEDELDPDEDVLDDETDDELDGIDFEAPGDLDDEDPIVDDVDDVDDDEEAAEDDLDDDGFEPQVDDDPLERPRGGR